jgi:hypothetical protein
LYIALAVSLAGVAQHAAPDNASINDGRMRDWLSSHPAQASKETTSIPSAAQFCYKHLDACMFAFRDSYPCSLSTPDHVRSEDTMIDHARMETM